MIAVIPAGPRFFCAQAITTPNFKWNDKINRIISLKPKTWYIIIEKIILSYSIIHIEVIYLGHVKYLRHNVGWHVTYQWYTICLGNERKFNSFGSVKKMILENYYTSVQCTYFIKLHSITHLFQFCSSINNAQCK